MTSLTTIIHEFEGEPLTTITYKDEPHWIGRQIGDRLDYAGNGKRLVTRIRREWSSEFVEGRDYDMLTGDDLAALKTMLGQGTLEVPSHTRNLMLLRESGLHLVLAKTDKPIGLRLRRFLADRVLPQLVRDGRYTPEREVVEGRIVVVAGPSANDSSPVAARESRLFHQTAIRGRWVDLCDRRLRANALLRLTENLGDRIDGDTRAALEVSAAEIATGQDLGHLRPEVDPDWRSPTAIAHELGVTVQKLGRLITRLGLRQEDPELARPVLNKAQRVDRVVVTWLYSPAAVERIAEALRDGAPTPDAE